MNSRIVPAVSNCNLRGLAIISLVFVMLAGCATAPPPKTSLQLQAFQSREFETTLKIGFASVMSVFQDLGYSIEGADFDTGFITAHSPTQQTFVPFVGQKMTHVNATAFVEPMGQNRTKIRLTYVLVAQTSSGYGMKGEKEIAIEEPEKYQESFEKIQKAIFVRENIE